jgi:predicted aldo/keto reductase-like oxidoreductase
MSEQETNKSRRHFIKKSVAGLAGVAILPSVMKGDTKEKTLEAALKRKTKMIYRTLGKTGLKLPIISMGVMNAYNPRLVEAALDAGIVHLDTAWSYLGGYNEKMIGEVIKNRPRSSHVIATKIWEPRDRKTGLYPKDASANTFIEKCETSLKRLNLDYVDILYHHNVYRVESVMFEPYVHALQKLKKDGKARFIGVSTHKNEPEILRAAADSGIYEVVLTAYNFRQLYHKEVAKAAAYAAKKGLGIVGMKAIAGRSHYIGGRGPATDARAALKWALQDENFHTNIPGMTSFDQLYTDLSIMENLELTPQENAAIKNEKKMTNLYCQQCDRCLSMCPGNLYIPDLMRSYMYAYGYKNLNAAKEALDGMDLENIPCKECATCQVKCPMGFDIKNKILAIARLKDVPRDFLV